MALAGRRADRYVALDPTALIAHLRVGHAAHGYIYIMAIPLSDQYMKRKFYMVHHKDKYFSEPLKNLIEMVYQWASEYVKCLS